jgi:RNA polymerase sigma factor (sigma-70 family)
MRAGRSNGLVDWLRRMAARAPEEDTADAQLLQRFVSLQDCVAFELLLRRHGQLVWGVCRRLLGQASDAEDAFQATFLVLARKAESITRRDSVRSWLYGTALRVAARFRGQATLRRTREKPFLEGLATCSGADAEGGELGLILDEEIGRLPAHERLAMILCCLEGKTHEEAAQELGCPRGTVGARLSRAKERLRRRLAARGVTLSTGALAAALFQREALALPAQQIRTTIEAMSRPGELSPRAVAFAEGVMQTMYGSKRSLVAVILLTGVLVGAAAGSLAYGTREGDGEPQQSKEPAADKTGQSSVAALAKERFMAAREVYDGILKQVSIGADTLDSLAKWAPHLLEAELDTATTKAERIAVLQAHVDRLKEHERQGRVVVDVGKMMPWQLSRFRCFRLEAELRLAREKAK